MKKMKIFTVGGTIDKIYFDAQSEYEVGSPTIEKMLERFNVYFDYSITSLFQKDSLEMTDEDRSKIFKAVSECSEENILITHGTDTMDQTARALSDIKGKTIVLTGSLLPANFRESDAEFNIGCALGGMWSADPGVYIAMNGFIFSWRDVYKDRIEMQFRQRLNQ
ncbi:MAG: asparaginase domain-containing protein [Lentisphaeraceae bacterium]|nr:asparaginase domain-containing protein [Lentisphaeraceae bacterium]